MFYAAVYQRFTLVGVAAEPSGGPDVAFVLVVQPASVRGWKHVRNALRYVVMPTAVLL